MKPVCNQIEFHPYFQRQELVAYLNSKEIAVVAWSPLGTGAWSSVAPGDKPLADPVIATIAKSHNVSPAQVILRWNLQLGITPIPKSENAKRIAENYQIFDFELSAEDLDKISKLDKNTRLGGDPNDISSFEGVTVPD